MDELILVRHGETTGNSAVRLYGRTDIALSDLGRRQMSRVREALDSEAFDTVITSPLRRGLIGLHLYRRKIHPATPCRKRCLAI